MLSKLDSIDGLLSLAGMADRDQTEAALGRDMDAVEALRLVMNEPMVSNAVVVHLRFITSAYLKVGRGECMFVARAQVEQLAHIS